ncbi:MAG: nucleoside triphosphate pyrophosphohydrolase [Gammaproteobacteria bacterium]|nr:nucleoside triphosphate pyrophosphohydrolase [Gammaproteobacteria bacterium]
MADDHTVPATIEDLLEIMAQLRKPETGCPWDLQQDFRSIAPYTLEEAYEVVDAIEQGEERALKEELGDLLFQVVYHAQMAHEAGWFDFNAVIAGICEKMVRRHPHVFGDDVIKTAAAQTRAWELHKERERGRQGSVLDSVPLALPALTRAAKLQKRASRVGFDWPSIHGVSDKVEEELEELCEEIQSNAGADALMDEAGDLLFAVVNMVRHAGIDPEAALRQGNRKFSRRFRMVEKLTEAAGMTVAETDLDTLDCYWDQVKELEVTDHQSGNAADTS